MALSHRINRTRNDAQCNALAETFYRYRGIVIRSLREDINVEHKRTGDIVFASILTLSLADVSIMIFYGGNGEPWAMLNCVLPQGQQGASPNWRCHLDGVQRLITLRGGFRALAGSESLAPLLRYFLLYVGVDRKTVRGFEEV